MDEVKRIQELLEMHCSFRMDGCDCVDMKEKCSACLARHLVGHGVTIPVRCKECKHWKHFDHLGCTDFVKVCMLSNYMIGENGYCLYGERKTE